MRFATRLLVLAALVMIPGGIEAAPARCWLITTTSALDISAGAVTTSAFTATPGGVRPDATIPSPTYLKVAVDLTDANDLITNIQLGFTAAETSGGTYRKTPLCADAAPTLTCGAVDVDWNPQTHGKNWWVKPIDWGWPYGKITVTPTGHGAADTVVLTIYGCGE